MAEQQETIFKQVEDESGRTRLDRPATPRSASLASIRQGAVLRAHV